MGSSLAEWVADRLKDHRSVESCRVVNLELLEVQRKDGSVVHIVCVKFDLLKAEHILEAVRAYPDMGFLLNIPKDARVAQDAFIQAKESGIAFGGLGDTMRALGEPKPKDWVHPEVKYRERFFAQHTRISAFVRLDNSRYRLDRFGLPSVTVFVSDAYEVTAEGVRTAIERFGAFDAFVTTNPNAIAISPQASMAAEASDRKVYRWKDFVSALHRPWR